MLLFDYLRDSRSYNRYAAAPDYDYDYDMAAYEEDMWALWDELRARYPQLNGDLAFGWGNDGPVTMLNLPGGQSIVFDDGIARSDAILWRDATIFDELTNPQTWPYPWGAPSAPPGRSPRGGFNPGLAHSLPLLKELYGLTPEAVRKSCVEVFFLGAPISFNLRHGAAEALKRVELRLQTYLAAHPEHRRYCPPPVPKPRSASLAVNFGVGLCLDLADAPKRERNPSLEAVKRYRKDFPQGIVDAFEAEGFIWGGKWQDYEFGYFEYQGRRID